MIDLTEPRSRRSDPSTSHEAARKARSSAKNHHAAIERVLREQGPLICSEIAEHLPITNHQISRRMIELERMGRAHRAAEKRPNAKGNNEQVWAAGKGSGPAVRPESRAELLRKITALDRENQILKRELERERKRNRQLGLFDQEE